MRRSRNKKGKQRLSSEAMKERKAIAACAVWGAPSTAYADAKEFRRLRTATMGVAPRPYKLLKKLDQNFSVALVSFTLDTQKSLRIFYFEKKEES